VHKQLFCTPQSFLAHSGGETVLAEASGYYDAAGDASVLLVDTDGPARGGVLEGFLESGGRGHTLRVLLYRGCLRNGDHFVAGTFSGRVQGIKDEHGDTVDAGRPGEALEIMVASTGLPEPGDAFVVGDAKACEAAAETRGFESVYALQPHVRRRRRRLIAADYDSEAHFKEAAAAAGETSDEWINDHDDDETLYAELFEPERNDFDGSLRSEDGVVAIDDNDDTDDVEDAVVDGAERADDNDDDDVNGVDASVVEMPEPQPVVLKVSNAGALQMIFAANRDGDEDGRRLIEIIHAGVGKVTEKDVRMAAAAQLSVIHCFRTGKHGRRITTLAAQQRIEIRQFDVYLDLLADMGVTEERLRGGHGQ
jgi:translation initiation factor IF-2